MQIAYSKTDRVVSLIEAVDAFGCSVSWYSRQRKVRRILFRHPLYVLRDLWRRALVRGRSAVLWERATTRQKVETFEQALGRIEVHWGALNALARM